MVSGLDEDTVATLDVGGYSSFQLKILDHAKTDFNANPMRSRVFRPLLTPDCSRSSIKVMIIPKSYIGVDCHSSSLSLTAVVATPTGFVMKMEHVDAQQTATSRQKQRQVT